MRGFAAGRLLRFLDLDLPGNRRPKSSFGVSISLALVDALTSEQALRSYHLLPAVRGDLLAKLGRLDEARAEFERAASLTRNARERKLLLDRARASHKFRVVK
jgi:predicted RNA polymerase sigma factor